MFERFKHHLDKGRCLPYLRFENGTLKCRVCENVAGLELGGEFSVFKSYAKHSNAIREAWENVKRKSRDEDEAAWREVKQEIAEIPSYITHEYSEKELEEYLKTHPEDSKSPFVEKIYDCEDSATFDPDLVDGLLERETEDE